MPEIVSNADIRLDDEDLTELQAGFRLWIEQVEDVRRDRMHSIWEKAAKNYDGKAGVMTLPWRGASNAVLNITQSHTDSIQARLFAAGATQDPTYIIKPSTGEPVTGPDGVEIVDATKYALWWQEISKHIEQYEVNHGEALEEATWISALYGDAWIYVSWEKDEVVDVTLDAEGNIVKTPRTIKDQPKLTVLHPERVYLAPWDDDPQEARTVAFDFPLDEHDLNLRDKRKVYRPGRVAALRKLLNGEPLEDGQGIRQAMDRGGYLKEWGRGGDNKSELRALLDEQAGIDPSTDQRALTMLKVFQRVDIDGDGIPEEIQFEVEKSSGTVAMGRYANLLHRKRPLVHLYFNRRPGSPYNRGVPEMLFNAQKILNNLIRDLLNNNKVKNTKLFLAKQGSSIKKQSEIFPSRLLMVGDPDKDFKVLDLGSSGGVTGLQEISLVQMWAERLTGVSDANLGLEKKSRTPVGTTQALIEEGSKRLDRVIDRQREAQRDMWGQVLSLYRQNADPRKLAQWAGIEDGDLDQFLAAWSAVPAERLEEYLHIKPQVSSSVFNRAAQKQEILTVMGQVQNYYMQLINLANLVGGAVQSGDPNFPEMVKKMAKGGHRLMQKFLALHDEKEQDELNPDDLITLLEGVTSVPTGTPGTEPAGSDPAEAARSASASGADPGENGEAVGRPTAGIPRVPGDANAAPIPGAGP